MAIRTSQPNHSIISTTLNAWVQFMRQLMSGNENAAKVDDFWGQVIQLYAVMEDNERLKLGFKFVTQGK